MYSLLRPLLFRQDPEAAHHATLKLLALLGNNSPAGTLLAALYQTADAPIESMGLRFRNRLGLAAGYDKDGTAWRGLAALGFGHIEIGTVTPKPQTGNTQPRVFRLVEDQAIINRMGFPSKGAEFVARQLAGERPENLILGVNLGKNKDTPLDSAHEDYQKLIEIFSPLADYLTINISSPNTLGLRDLQSKEYLEKLLGEILTTRNRQTSFRPLLVKLAPDLSDVELSEALDAILSSGVEGIIATNTTIQRPTLHSDQANESGGLSGAPLTQPSEEILTKIIKHVQGKLPVISVGGIMSPQDAIKRFEAGADLVQIYTGLIYAGPGLGKDINGLVSKRTS